MNKKGFTLIELLAVIVILAIILLIAMPIVLNVINEARRGAFESTARGLFKAAETEFYRESLNNTPSVTTYSGPDYDTLEYSGQAPDNGVIYVASNGEIAMWLFDDTYCAILELGEQDIAVTEQDTAGDCTDQYPGTFPTP